MRLPRYLLATCVSLFALQGQAETLNHLYQVHEPVSSQAAQDRDQAIQQALQTLVLRLTGDPKAFDNPGLSAIKSDPRQIISQFGFEAGPPETLQVDFDPVSTDNALRQAGLATWGSNRPSILSWWLADSTEGSVLVGDGQATAEPLRRAAQHRGLPLRLPLADLEEQLVATAQTLEGNDPAPLKGPSERYSADGLLAVHARQEGDHWTGAWKLWVGNQREQGTAQGADQAALADAVMSAVSQRLAPRYIVKPGVSTDMTLQLEGMNLERYAQIGRLLEPFGGRLKSVAGDKGLYQVTGSPEQLRAQLALAKLQELPAEVPAPVAPALTPVASGTPAASAAPAAPTPVAPAPADMRFGW